MQVPRGKPTLQSIRCMQSCCAAASVPAAVQGWTQLTANTQRATSSLQAASSLQADLEVQEAAMTLCMAKSDGAQSSSNSLRPQAFIWSSPLSPHYASTSKETAAAAELAPKQASSKKRRCPQGTAIPTEFPAPGQKIQFKVVVSGQCREFEAVIAPWKEGFEAPTYHGRGQLLGHVAVTGVKALLPARSRDRDVRLLRDFAAQCHVAALCRNMPYSVRRSGAWRAVD